MELLSDMLTEVQKQIEPLIDTADLPEGVSKEDLSAFIAVLSIPDEEFDIMKPLMLEQIKIESRKPENVYEVLKRIKTNGSTIEEFQSQIEEMINNLISTAELSPTKIDFLQTFVEDSINALYEVDGKDVLIKIPIQLIHDDAKVPAYAHPTDAGLDVYALEDITINPGETKLIPLGFKVAIPEGYEIQVRPKSGRCLKTKLRVANAPGTIDAGYRDEVGVIIDNIDPFIKNATIDNEGRITNVEYGSSYTIGKGEKFAQLVLAKLAQSDFRIVEDVSTYGADRGGGFGSTDIK